MLDWLRDPALFNHVIMALYACNVVRWAIEREPFGVCYWASALAITATVTWIPKPHG